MSLAGRRVLVTGANRGIGAQFVESALARGAAHVVAAARDVASLPAFTDPARVVPVRLDVTDAEQVAAAAAAHPDVDVLVSNAGIPCFRPVLGDAGTEAAFRQALDVNCFGPLRLARAFAANLRRPGAGAVFVLSVAAVALSRSSPGYSASKAAALMLALGLREELREAGVQVTVVLPGFVDTEMSTPLTMPKADPRMVADAALDGWAVGEATVWPDPFARLVRDSIGEPLRQLLDRPREIMTAIQQTYAGSS